MGAAVVFATALVISPIVVRNYLRFPISRPQAGRSASTFGKGLGETELGRQHGFLSATTR
jgi:hypothetical protein